MNGFALLLAASLAITPTPPEMLPVTETADGSVAFSINTGSLRKNPFGFAVQIIGTATEPRPLERTNPQGPRFVRVVSNWVVGCSAGTHSIVEESFIDQHGKTVAHNTGDPAHQEPPVRGSTADQILRAVCEYANGRTV